MWAASKAKNPEDSRRLTEAVRWDTLQNLPAEEKQLSRRVLLFIHLGNSAKNTG